MPGELVNSADEAAAAATRLGFPVVLKIQSEQITHKSDIGGVALRLNNEADVRAAFEKVYAAGKAVPGAVIDGVLVAPMRSGGLELLAGITKDPTFGPVLAVGLGGVWVEIMQDTSLRVLPVDAERGQEHAQRAARRRRCCRAPAAVSRSTSTRWPRSSPSWVTSRYRWGTRWARSKSTRCGSTAARSKRWTSWSLPSDARNPELRNPPGAARGVPCSRPGYSCFPGRLPACPVAARRQEASGDHPERDRGQGGGEQGAAGAESGHDRPAQCGAQRRGDDKQ